MRQFYIRDFNNTEQNDNQKNGKKCDRYDDF